MNDNRRYYVPEIQGDGVALAPTLSELAQLATLDAMLGAVFDTRARREAEEAEAFNREVAELNDQFPEEECE